MTKVMILNGPNLNMLGVREPDIYGRETLADIERLCADKSNALGYSLTFRQSNHEGEIVDWIQDAYHSRYDALVINAAAYTHTSLALHDALKLLSCPIIEVHLSEPMERENFRHFSYIESVATHRFAGHGAKGYVLALEKLQGML